MTRAWLLLFPGRVHKATTDNSITGKLSVGMETFQKKNTIAKDDSGQHGRFERRCIVGVPQTRT